MLEQQFSLSVLSGVGTLPAAYSAEYIIQSLWLSCSYNSFEYSTTVVSWNLAVVEYVHIYSKVLGHHMAFNGGPGECGQKPLIPCITI